MGNERSKRIDDSQFEFEIEKDLHWRKRAEIKRRDESLRKLSEDHAA